MGEPIVDLSNIQIDLLFGKILFCRGLGTYCFTRNRTMIGSLFENVLKSLVKSKGTRTGPISFSVIYGITV